MSLITDSCINTLKATELYTLKGEFYDVTYLNKVYLTIFLNTGYFIAIIIKLVPYGSLKRRYR